MSIATSVSPQTEPSPSSITKATTNRNEIPKSHQHSVSETSVINSNGTTNSKSTKSTENKPSGGSPANSSSRSNKNKNNNNNNNKPEKKDGFFADFNVLKMVGAGVIGAVVGLGYSVVDQTILHKPKVSALPYTSTRLQQQMPDVLDRAEKFYAHKTLVRSRRGKQEFERLAGEMLKQSEYFAAIYAKMMNVHAQDRGVTPLGLEEHFRLKHQAKRHWEVIVQFLRQMAVLINAPDNLIVDNDFNQLYEAFQNRFYVIHQSILGAP